MVSKSDEQFPVIKSTSSSEVISDKKCSLDNDVLKIVIEDEVEKLKIEDLEQTKNIKKNEERKVVEEIIKIDKREDIEEIKEIEEIKNSNKIICRRTEDRESGENQGKFFEVKKKESGKNKARIGSYLDFEESRKSSHVPGVKSTFQMSNSVLIDLFEKVNRSGRPNFRGCRIALPNNRFNIPLWRDLLDDYSDKVICEFLEFGFPLDFDKSVVLCTDERRNHKGARQYPEFVNEYLGKEVQKSRIAGPFKSNPLSVPIMVSPLNTVPKTSSDERRIIVDLSWPLKKGSVNSGISKEYYLEEKIESHYASVEEICKMVLDIGQGAVLYKRDLRQAYRQFPVDPADYYLLGYHWNNLYYFDTVLAMGQRNAGVGCSRVTNAVMHIHAKCGYNGASYLDDLIGVSPSSTGSKAYEHLGKILRDLGLEENIPKACPPSVIQTVLGVVIDTENMTISVTSERMEEIKNLLNKWENKTVCKKKELQSLIGKLCFVCKCVRQSRVFLNRLLEVLRSVDWAVSTRIKLSTDFFKELKWWSMFMNRFNGVAFIPSPVWTEPDVTIATDSCLDGCGGICDQQYFHSRFPTSILQQGLPIHKLEFLAVLIGARIWGHKFGGMKIRIYCDNKSVVDVINSSKTKDGFMATCLRELWLVVSSYEFELRAVHLPGEENRVADWLSRWHLGHKYQNAFKLFTVGSQYEEIHLCNENFQFSGFL